MLLFFSFFHPVYGLKAINFGGLGAEPPAGRQARSGRNKLTASANFSSVHRFGLGIRPVHLSIRAPAGLTTSQGDIETVTQSVTAPPGHMISSGAGGPLTTRSGAVLSDSNDHRVLGLARSRTRLRSLCGSFPRLATGTIRRYLHIINSLTP